LKTSGGDDLVDEPTADKMTSVFLSAILDYRATDEVSAAIAAARDAVDAVLQSPPVFRPGAPRELFDARLAAATLHADAHLEAVDIPAAALAAEMKLSSALGERLRAIAALQSRIATDAQALLQSPPRVLAAWHLRATAAMDLPAERRGQPRAASEKPDDPLNAGLPDCDPATAVSVIMSLLSENPRALAPIAQAALVHLALLTGAPFAAANGALGRAAAHAVLMARGTDPNGRIAITGALSHMGRPAYVRALRDAASMTGDALDAWVMWWCDAVIAGARYSTSLMSEVALEIDAQQAST